MTKSLPHLLEWSDVPNARLRLVDWPDAEHMRQWKNTHKQSFFHKLDITPEQQSAWFAAYMKRPDDHNYAVEERVGERWEPVGLLAARMLDGTVDVYNVMRGQRTQANLVHMGQMLWRFCGDVARHYDQPITCKVLINNPAISWYLENGFSQLAQAEDHVVLCYQSKGASK